MPNFIFVISTVMKKQELKIFKMFAGRCLKYVDPALVADPGKDILLQ